MTRRLPIVLALLAAIVVFAPRLPGDHRSGTQPGSSGGGSSAASVVPGVSCGGELAGWHPCPSEKLVGSTIAPPVQQGAPQPSGGIGLPASAVNPDYTAPPDLPLANVPSPFLMHSLAGQATWYRYHPGQAAAARLLREHYGSSWRGAVVTVTGPAGQAVVRLTDYESSTIPGRLIDLDSHDFQRVCGQLSIGTCVVSVAP